MITIPDNNPQVSLIVLNAVRNFNEKNIHVGTQKLALFLKGSKSKDILSLVNEPIYGGLMWHDIDAIAGFIDQLEYMGLIKRKIIPGSERDYPVLELAESGSKVLDEKSEIPLQVIKKVNRITVGETEKITLNLFKSGKSIGEIANERKLAESTI